MRIPSGKTDQVVYFVAYDSADHTTRKTGLSSFTIYRSRNGGTATVYTTPTVTELSSSNMPGVYALLIDEDTTIASGSDSEEYAVHITASGMDPVSRTIELYRREVTTGNQLLVDSSGRVDVIKVAGTTQTARDIGASVLLSSGTGTGQLDFTSGVVKANVTQNAGSAITSAAGVQEVKIASIAANAITATAIAADAITDAKVASDVTIASVTGAVGSVTGNVGGNVTGSVGSVIGLTVANLDAAVSTRLASGSYTAPLDAAGTRTAVGLASANLDAQLSTIAGYIDTEVAAIKAKTDNLPSDPADASDIAGSFSTVNATLATIAGYIDTEVAAIKAKTDLIPASPAAVGDAMTLTLAYDAAKTAPSQASVDAIKAVTDNLAPMLEDSSGYRFTAHALEEAPTGAGGGSALTVEDIRAEMDSNSARLAAIQAKTDNLPASPAATGAAMTLTSAYDAAKTAASQASVDGLPTNAELATTLAAADDATLAAIAALPTAATVDAIKAQTDQLTFTKANELDVNVQSVNDVTVVGLGSSGSPWGPG